MDIQQASAASIEFSLDVVIVVFALNRDRDIQRDVAVAGVEQEVGGKLFRNTQRHASISSGQAPTLPDRGARERFGFDAPVAGPDLEMVEAAPGQHSPIAGMGSEGSIDAFDFEVPIATLQFHFTSEITQPDFAIMRVQAHFPFAGHADFDDSAAVPNAHDGEAVRETHVKFDRIPGLMVMDLDAALAKAPFCRGDMRFDLLFIPGIDVNLGIRGLDAQFGLAADVEGFGPFLGLGCPGEEDGNAETERNPEQTSHVDSLTRAHVGRVPV